MQRGKATEITKNSYAVVTERVSRDNRMQTISTVQVVAVNGDQLTVVTPGTSISREVPRASAQAYQDVYGTAVPHPNARPIINQMA